MKSVVILFAVLIVLGLVASDSIASGAYLGAGIGNTFFSSEYEDALDQMKKIDENATAWKIFGGFNAGRFVGVEGGYRSFGKVSSTYSDNLFETETTGWDIEGLGRLQIAVVDIFGKAGVMFSSTKATILGKTYDESSTNFFWGLGAGVHFGPVGARLEWESIVVGGPDNVSMVSLSATIGF